MITFWMYNILVESTDDNVFDKRRQAKLKSKSNPNINRNSRSINRGRSRRRRQFATIGNSCPKSSKPKSRSR